MPAASDEQRQQSSEARRASKRRWALVAVVVGLVGVVLLVVGTIAEIGPLVLISAFCIGYPAVALRQVGIWGVFDDVRDRFRGRA